jgi:2-dehydropantoate 2-reductase
MWVMRIGVMGAGGLGGAIGGLLARAGEDVSFIARRAHLEAIRSHGSTIRSLGVDDFTIEAMATDDPVEVGPVDLIVFGVKLYDLELAAEQMRPMIGPATVILPIQNGIDAAERIGEIVGPSLVIGGSALVSGRIEAPGIIYTSGTHRLTFGELVDGTSPRTERIQATLERAGFRTEVPPTFGYRSGRSSCFKWVAVA